MTRTKETKLLNTVNYQDDSHKTILLHGLHALWRKSQLLDITLVVEGTVFRAHKVVLSACSDYFRAMFTDNMLESRQTEVHLHGISAKGFGQLLEYAYTTRLALNLANVQDVLAASSHLQILNCIVTCSTYLQSQIDLDNCVDMATIAETYSLKELRIKVYRFMSGHLLEFSKTQGFYRLSLMQLENLLTLDFPVDCSEAEVFRIVLTWFFHVDNHEFNGRINYAVHIMKYVHFNEISKRKLDGILNKFFQDRPKYPWQVLEEIIGREYFLQTSGHLGSLSLGALLNSRGMEQAILKIGGFGTSGVTNEITYCFSWQKKWMHLTSIPHVEQCNYGTAVYSNELYIVGGCFNQSLQEYIHPFGFKYNPRFNKWSTISPMKFERCRFSLNAVGGLLYAVGGISEEEPYGQYESKTCECYNPTRDVWYPIANLPMGVSQHAGASVEDAFLYISGGIDPYNRCVSNVFCFDVEFKTWMTCAPMLQPRADHVMVAVGKCLYVCGGWTSDDTNRVLLDTIERYNPEENAWEVVTKIPTPRYHAGISLVDDRKIYFVGGFQSDTMIDKETANIEYYDIENEKWTTESKYPQDIWEHTIVTLCIPKCRDDMEIISSSANSFT
ncbi:kelch-like protein 26 [Anthonomus grandis grandis]|uniref:kelch-like protein 26 n=1 Tax=Anthonomus grandis grandis TaxID=2921223 RepID=UPI0021665FDE|nr:kelch-like protein 26 [Anthonomus grandis grandis]